MLVHLLHDVNVWCVLDDWMKHITLKACIIKFSESYLFLTYMKTQAKWMFGASQSESVYLYDLISFTEY